MNNEIRNKVLTMYNKIISQLYVGSLEDAKIFDEEYPITGAILCVLEHRPHDEPHNAFHIPIITDSDHVHTQQLDKINIFIDSMIKSSRHVLIHCAAGMERSPLATMYFLKNFYGISIDQAYEIVKKQRPQTMDRRSWLKFD